MIKIENQGRRDFLNQLAFASLALATPVSFFGCRDKADDGFKGSGKAPYKVWEEILYYLRTSPDHLHGKMQQLIKQGDPEAMFLFVRDELYLIPSRQRSIGSGNDLKWGVQYALRSGMATMYEKAALLTKMYQGAGIKASLKIERTQVTPEQAQTFFYRPIERQFAPKVSERMLRRWQKEMGATLGNSTAFETLKDSDQKGMLLAEKIWNTLDISEAYSYRKFDFRWPNYQTPVVEFEWADQMQYAHLFDPKTPFGQCHGGDPSLVRDAPEPKENKEKVSIKVSYRDSIDPQNHKELISGEWGAVDLVGNQVNLLFFNNLSEIEQATVPVGNIRTFTPAFSFQAIGQTTEEMASRSLLGQPITLEGKKIQINPNGEISHIGNAQLLPPRPGLQKKVVLMEADAQSKGYPRVKLSVWPKNAQGELVEGLSASDFSITENGKPIQALLESNQRTPRVLILSDGSGSMPSEYRGKGMDAFVTDLKTRILEQYPAAIIDHWVTPSALYSWLLKASQTENDLIIYATDGHNNDKFNPDDEAVYRNGPPAIVLNVYNTTNKVWTKSFDTMAKVTGGIHLPVSDQQAAMEGIISYLDKIPIQPYTFTYYSVGKETERKVLVTIDNKRIDAASTYQFQKSIKASQIGPSIIGVYLEVKYANQSVIKRVLAGWEYDIKPYEQPTQEMAIAVNDLFLGGLQFYFEGAGPTYAAVLSDLLKVKLSTRDWGEALIDGEQEKAVEAFKKGNLSLSGKALSLMSPLANPASNTSLTVPGGLRIGISTVNPGLIGGQAAESFDFLPTSDYFTLCNDPKLGFRRTMEQTAELAYREKALYQQSTWSMLEDKNWLALEQAREEKWMSQPNIRKDRYWRERIDRGALFRIFDMEAQSKAFWDIDTYSGELYGMLPNGKGGAEDYYEHDLEKYQSMVTSLNALMGILDHLKLLRLSAAGGVALGVVALYGELLVKLYGIASEAIMIMDASFVNDQIALALQQFACSVAKELAYAVLGPLGTMMSGLDTLIGMIAPEQNPFPCS